MEAPEGIESFQIRDYLAVLGFRKWIILVTLALVVGAALGFSYIQTPRYTAQTKVLVEPLPSGVGTDSVLQAVDVGVESQIVESQPVANIVRRDLSSTRSGSSLLSGLRVQGATTTTASTSGAQVLELSYTSSNVTFAAQAANAFTHAYIQYRKDQALNAVTSAHRAVQTRVDKASKQIDELTKERAIAKRQGNSSLAANLGDQKNILIGRIAVLEQQLEGLQPTPAQRSGGAQVIESAATPGSPSSPNYPKNLALAVLLGSFLGVGLAFLRDRLDDRFRDRDEIERSLGVPVLGAIPSFMTKRKSSKVITQGDPGSGASEAYRTLRTNLQFVLSEGGIKSLVITSALVGEGKTVTTVNLAVAFAQAGYRVILVDGDLRRPMIETYFGLRNQVGLASILSNGVDPWSAIQDPDIPGLRVLPSGPSPSTPAELLVSPNMRRLMALFEANCDLVLVDSPPLLAVADAAILTRNAGGAILVVDPSKSRRRAALHARKEIDRAGCAVLCSVLNAFDPGASPYYGYYGTYASKRYRARPNTSEETGAANGVSAATKSGSTSEAASP